MDVQANVEGAVQKEFVERERVVCNYLNVRIR